MLFQVLRALEGFAAEVALVRLQRDMNADMRGDMITLDGRSSTGAPLAGQVQVVCALAPDMSFAYMILRQSVSILPNRVALKSPGVNLLHRALLRWCTSRHSRPIDKSKSLYLSVAQLEHSEMVT